MLIRGTMIFCRLIADARVRQKGFPFHCHSLKPPEKKDKKENVSLIALQENNLLVFNCHTLSYPHCIRIPQSGLLSLTFEAILWKIKKF